MSPSTDVTSFLKALKSAKNVVALAGAGLSAASGIPTFRGAGGLWRNYDAMSLATPEAFQADPSLVWQFYHYRREAALKAHPNTSHHILASLSNPSSTLRQTLLNTDTPKTRFTFVTQNVDGLSVIALKQGSGADPKSSRVGRQELGMRRDYIEMHGNVFKTRCLSCGKERLDFRSPISKSLRGTEEVFEPSSPSGPGPGSGQGPSTPKIPTEDLPRCDEEVGSSSPTRKGVCGGLLRPGVVWFGETPERLDEIGEVLRDCDLLLVIGTSSTVYPAAGFASQVQRNRVKGKVAIWNLEETEGDEGADWRFLGPCEVTLGQVLGVVDGGLKI